MNYSIKHRLIGAATAAAMLVSAASYSPAAYAFAEGNDYMTWLQMDENWGETPMGNTTIGRSGCLITSLSIMAMDTGSLDASALKNLGIESAEEFDPGVLADAYTERDAFTKGGGIKSWGTISQIIPKMTFVRDDHLKSKTQHDIAQEIRSLMAGGLYIILNVNGHHWVYIEGIHGDDIYMMDPGSNERLVYDYYELAGENEYWALKAATAPVIEPEVLVVKDPLTYTEPSEYYVSTNNSLPVYSASPVDGEYSSSSERVCEMKKGWIATIDAYYEKYGRIVTGAGEVVGWVECDKLTPMYSYCYYEYGSGDINGDGNVDFRDLTALNDAMKAAASMPEGFSVLTSDERGAADLDFDGTVCAEDAELLLRKIYEPQTEPVTEPVTEEYTEPVTEYYDDTEE